MFLLDRLFAGYSELPASLQIQLAQIYGSSDGQLVVVVPSLSKQINGDDCGLYAIANMFEICQHGYDNVPEVASSVEISTVFSTKKIRRLPRKSFLPHMCSRFYVTVVFPTCTLTWLAVISVMPGITRSVLGSRIQLSHSSGYAHSVNRLRCNIIQQNSPRCCHNSCLSILFSRVFLSPTVAC